MFVISVYLVMGSVSVNGAGPRENTGHGSLKKVIPLPFISDRYQSTHF
jgi:hypothetical protein